MYKSIPENLPNKDLTTVIHFVVKMLNKYKSKENREIKIEDLPIIPEKNLLSICTNLLGEINIEEIKNQNDKIDFHIHALFAILKERLDVEINNGRSRGKELLERFKKEDE